MQLGAEDKMISKREVSSGMCRIISALDEDRLCASCKMILDSEAKRGTELTEKQMFEILNKFCCRYAGFIYRPLTNEQ